MCDCGHDRQAEPGTASGSVRAAEPREGAFEEVRRKPFALIGDVQDQCAGVLDYFKSSCACAVAECVLDEVGERLLESPTVDERDQIGPRCYLDRASRVGRSAAKAGCDRAKHFCDRDARAAER